ncbi:MAG: DUF4380 domain-containing protein [Clostridiales bacterium]|jgi:hypothetical protein|nr:DUF4380 domain-containing protein [Clostridiales bacterium]
MGVIVTAVNDATWGSCVKIANTAIELMVTVDFGPRVIHASLVGKENLMYEDYSRSKLGKKQKIYDDHLSLCGGHRLWIAPEILPRCYYPDSEPVSWELDEDTVVFTAQIEKVNNIQKIIRITMDETEPTVELEHIIKNCGAWDIEFAHWCITMTDKGGKCVIPMPDCKTDLLPNRSLTLWDYSEMNDERVYWGKNYITLTQNSEKVNPFKLGINNEDGWAAVFNKGQVFIKYFTPIEDGVYPDNGCTFETYTNGVMLECESLGPFVHLEPGEQDSFLEEWQIFEADKAPSNDETEIAEIISKYVV